MESGLKTWAQTSRWALVFGEISKHETGENEEYRGLKSMPSPGHVPESSRTGPGQGARHGRTTGRTTGSE